MSYYDTFVKSSGEINVISVKNVNGDSSAAIKMNISSMDDED